MRRSNYAPTILPQKIAQSKGFAQVLWLFGDQITEVGTMNMFVLWVNEQGKKELVTAPLDGTILPGVTRQCVLDLTRDWGEFEVSERTYTIQELAKSADEGRVRRPPFSRAGMRTTGPYTPLPRSSWSPSAAARRRW